MPAVEPNHSGQQKNLATRSQRRTSAPTHNARHLLVEARSEPEEKGSVVSVDSCHCKATSGLCLSTGGAVAPIRRVDGGLLFPAARTTATSKRRPNASQNTTNSFSERQAHTTRIGVALASCKSSRCERNGYQKRFLSETFLSQRAYTSLAVLHAHAHPSMNHGWLV